MIIKSILILTALISVDTYELIHEETIRGVDIARVNVTGIVGQWHLLATTKPENQYLCVSSVIQQQSNDNFTMSNSISLVNGQRRKPTNNYRSLFQYVYRAAINDDSNIIIFTRDGWNEYERAMVIFDVNYDSHMAIYLAETVAQIKYRTDGLVFVYSRELTLSDEILEEIRESNFYRQLKYPGNELFRVKAICE